MLSGSEASKLPPNQSHAELVLVAPNASVNHKPRPFASLHRGAGLWWPCAIATGHAKHTCLKSWTHPVVAVD